MPAVKPSFNIFGFSMAIRTGALPLKKAIIEGLSWAGLKPAVTDFCWEFGLTPYVKGLFRNEAIKCLL